MRLGLRISEACSLRVEDIERPAGLTVSPHSLRHYFGAGLISRGVSVVAVSRWLGHSSPEIAYRVYAYLNPTTSSPDVPRLPKPCARSSLVRTRWVPDRDPND